MALVTCPDCNTQMSDRAAACLKCGAPIAAARTDVTTTEATGKPQKMIQLIGVLCILAGVVSCTAQAPQAAALLLIVGVVLWLVGRMAAWWHHG
jgi:hypothetical protein